MPPIRTYLFGFLMAVPGPVKRIFAWAAGVGVLFGGAIYSGVSLLDHNNWAWPASSSHSKSSSTALDSPSITPAPSTPAPLASPSVSPTSTALPSASPSMSVTIKPTPKATTHQPSVSASVSHKPAVTAAASKTPTYVAPAPTSAAPAPTATHTSAPPKPTPPAAPSEALAQWKAANPGSYFEHQGDGGGVWISPAANMYPVGSYAETMHVISGRQGGSPIVYIYTDNRTDTVVVLRDGTVVGNGERASAFSREGKGGARVTAADCTPEFNGPNGSFSGIETDLTLANGSIDRVL